METEKEKSLRLPAVFVSALIAVALLWLLAAGPARAWMQERFGSVNLPALAAAVAVFVGMLILQRPAARFGLGRGSGPARRKSGFVGVGLAALFAVYLLVCTILETELSGAGAERTFLHRYPVLLRCALILLCAGIALYPVQKSRVLETGAAKWNRMEIAFIALLVCLSAYAAYMPNVLNGNSGNLYHFHAYFNSIYQLFHKQFFFEGITSIYGHYAFFFLPLYKIAQAIGLHNEVMLVMLALASLQGISVLLYAYVLRVFIQNRFLRILGLAAVCMAQVSLQQYIYIQVYPHRTFPYAVMAALLALWFSKKDRRLFICVIGYLASAIIVIWSTECGIVCALTWAALHCCAAIQKNGSFPWVKVCAHFIALFASVAGGYMLTCCLNLLCGGAWISIREFIFPLMTKSYMTGFLEKPLAAFPSAWVPITATLLYFLGIGLSDTVLCTRQPGKTSASAVSFALGVLGLGTLTYTFNRPAYGNFYIMLPLMSILMCLLVQRTVPQLCLFLENGIPKANKLSLWDGLRGGIGAVLLSVLLLLGILGMTNYGAAQEKRLPYRDLYSLEYMKVFFAQMTSPEDCTAIGRGALEICAALGWDNGLPVMDYSDITIDPAHLAYADNLLASLDGKCVLFEASAFALHETGGMPGFEHFLEHHIQAETIIPPSEVSDLSFYYFVPA